MINLENYSGTVKFGDEKFIKALNYYKVKDLRKTRVTIDYKKLISVGLDSNVALDLIERLIKK